MLSNTAYGHKEISNRTSEKKKKRFKACALLISVLNYFGKSLLTLGLDIVPLQAEDTFLSQVQCPLMCNVSF